jgi:hypothetical protein
LTREDAPDVLALPLEDAVAILEGQGWRWRIVLTSPVPSQKVRTPPGGDMYVVRQRPGGEGEVELTVARGMSGPSHEPNGKGNEYAHPGGCHSGPR